MAKTAKALPVDISTHKDDLNRAYLKILGRECDPSGLALYGKHMDNGMSINQIERTLTCSDEFALAHNAFCPTDYCDSDITFVMGLYHDNKRADGALSRLREHFPGSHIILRSDGDDDPENRALAKRYSADYWEEDRLYPIENGGLMNKRLLELYLGKPTPYFIKIDTDTAIHRRFNFLLSQTAIYGSLQDTNGSISVQGGFNGMTFETAQLIYDSGLLDDARLCDPGKHSAESNYFRRMGKRARHCGLCSFDWIFGWVASELNIPMLPFTEVRCRWRSGPSLKNDDLRYALTHPVYFEEENYSEASEST